MLKFEPAEVLEVFTDTVDTGLSGAVRARYNISQQGRRYESTGIFYPLDSNILQVPVLGEEVLACEFAGRNYYMSKLNRRNLRTTESNFGASAFRDVPPDTDFVYGKYFNPSSRVKKLLIREGDTIIQGRFGNSIRLGSNQFMTGSQDSRNLTESPNIKIVAGGFTRAPVYSENLESNISSEYLDDEKSSIYLTTDEYVPYQSVGVEPTFDNNPTYFKPQIILQSDRLVFNSKGEEGGIGIYSRDNVEIKSTGKVEIDSPTIDIGSITSGQAALGNQDFIFLIESLIDSKISSNESEIAEELVTSGGSPTPKSIELTKEIVRLQNIKDSKTYLSKKINVE